MNIKRRLWLPVFVCAALYLALVGWSPAAPHGADDLKPTVILISIDAFRFDYLAQYNPPNLTALAHEGVLAKWMMKDIDSRFEKGLGFC